MQVRNEEISDPLPKRFDTRVEIRDPKTGDVIRRQPYRLIIRNGEQRFIRDGIEYYPNGDPVDPALYLVKQEKANEKPRGAFQEQDEKYKQPIVAEMVALRDSMMGELRSLKEELFAIASVLKEEKAKLDAEKAQLAASKTAPQQRK